MGMPKLARVALVIATSAGLAACAPGSTGGGGDMAEPAAGGGVAIEIDNDTAPPSSITVYIVPESGGRARLGDVNANQVRTFNYSPPSPGMQFNLRAEIVGGGARGSQSFNLVGATAVEWQVSQSTVRISR